MVGLVYLDTSLLVSLFWADAHAMRARSFLHSARPMVVVSDLALAEHAAAMTRLVRMGIASKEQSAAAFSGLDAWLAREATRILISAADLSQATGWIRHLNFPLRAPDAIHIAAARRLGATLVTFDAGMAHAAATLGLAVAAA